MSEPPKPSEGVVKTGGNQDTSTWKIVHMRKPPEKFKIVDDANKNIATDFTTESKAQEYLTYYQWLEVNPVHPPVGEGLDENGVQMLYATLQGGSSYFYKMTDNIENSKYIQTDENKATSVVEDKIAFKRLVGNPVGYSKGPKGKTVRVNINGGGFIDKQAHTWKDEPTPEFIWTTRDNRNAEFTYYARAMNKVHPHTEFSSKMREGIHTGKGDPRSSCFEISFKIGLPNEMKSSQEYNHPDYVFADTTRISKNLSQTGQWIGRKTVVWNMTNGRVMVRDYVDWNPFNPTNGRPNNNWDLLQQQAYGPIQKEGYNKAPTWGGAFAFRCDGHKFVDVAIISIREIVPPAV